MSQELAWPMMLEDAGTTNPSDNEFNLRSRGQNGSRPEWIGRHLLMYPYLFDSRRKNTRRRRHRVSAYPRGR